jgi:hypothetical protein
MKGGRIICINGTQTYAGYLLNRWTSDNPEMSLTADKSVSDSPDLLRKSNPLAY